MEVTVCMHSFGEAIGDKCVMNVSAKYFEEISQDTGKYCFGVVDTLKALECGAVEILICWENLDLVRWVYIRIPVYWCIVNHIMKA